MKKLIAVLAAVLMLAALTACGAQSSKDEESGKPSEASQTTEATKASEAEKATEAATEATEATETTPQINENTTYNVGEFSVFVPKGWQAIPVPDHLDQTKTATNDVRLAKGAVYDEATQTWNADEVINFYITRLNKEDFAKASNQKEEYAKDFSVKDMADMKTGSLTWKGFSVNPIGADVYIMTAESGEGGYHVAISTALGFSLDDPDLQTILASITTA